MYRDFQDGNPVEVEQILGDLIRRRRLASRHLCSTWPRLNVRVYEYRTSSNSA
jgi:hypothetical protein